MEIISDEYIYKPIQAAEVRLCKFIKETDHICADLVTYSIDDLAPYQTLSYVWAEDDRTPSMNWKIKVGGRSLAVLESLKPFFDALRDKDLLLDGTWWWIDSICINQNNDEEKNHQVKLMRQLYSDCRACIIWLGSATRREEEVVDFIQDLDRSRGRIVTENMREKFRGKQYAASWSLLVAFFTRKWWTRVWTLQEFTCPPSITFWIGVRAVSRSTVSRAILFAESCAPPDVISSVYYRQAWNRRRIWLRHNNYLVVPPQYAGLSLPALAAYCCANEATQPLDRLYGLLGLVTVDRDLLTIRYSQSVEDSYRDYTVSFVAKHQSLDICVFATIFPPSKNSNLPSWIPDWRQSTDRGRAVLPLMVSQSGNASLGNLRPIWSVEDEGELVRYKANGHTKAWYTIVGNTLSVKGFVIDGLGSQGDHNWLQNTIAASDAWTAPCDSHDILLGVCRCLTLDRQDRYLGLPMPEENYLNQFIHLCKEIIENPMADQNFSNWFKKTKSLDLRGRKFLDVVTQCVDNSGEHGSEDDLEVQAEETQSFRGRFIDTVRGMSMRLMITSCKRLAMIPRGANDGDLICVLYGCSVPVLLRGVEFQENFYTLVGECYVDGLMHGEALSLELAETMLNIV